VLFAIDAAGDALSFAATGNFWKSAAGVSISATFLYALSRTGVRRYFNRVTSR
jgi:hypothetical protein